MHTLDEVIAAMKRCVGKNFPCDGCIYENNCSIGDTKQMEREALYWLRAFAANTEHSRSLSDQESRARLLTVEEAMNGHGHGWEEVWFEEDEDMPEKRELFECVYINGRILCADGDIGGIDPETYNRPYHSRLWVGETKPGAEVTEEEPWER